MKKFKIPVVWSMVGTMIIEAETLEEAELKAYWETPLPEDAAYLENSLELDKDLDFYGEEV